MIQNNHKLCFHKYPAKKKSVNVISRWSHCQWSDEGCKWDDRQNNNWLVLIFNLCNKFNTNRKCWNCFIPSSRMKLSARKVCHLYRGTLISWSSVPTSCATLTPVVVLSSVTRTMSSRQETGVLRNFCFSKPKHQSGPNFVWPATIKFSSMDCPPDEVVQHVPVLVLTGTFVAVQLQCLFT